MNDEKGQRADFAKLGREGWDAKVKKHGKKAVVEANARAGKLSAPGRWHSDEAIQKQQLRDERDRRIYEAYVASGSGGQKIKQKIARKFRVSERTVYKAIKKMKEASD